MIENRRRILDCLAQGKISVDEAERLLTLIEQPAGKAGTSDIAQVDKLKPKYLHIMVQSSAEGGPEAKSERVNIRVPLAIIRSGMKLQSFIPSDTATKINEALKSKGIDLNLRNVKEEDLERLVKALSDLEVDIQEGKEKVHIYVE